MSRIRSFVPTLTALALLMVGLIAGFIASTVWAPPASAQDIEVLLDEIVEDLENQGWFIEDGGLGTASGFDDLVADTADADDQWYFVSLAEPVDDGFAADLRDLVRPTGNVLVYFLDDEFESVELASNESEAIEDRALEEFFDDDWVDPEDFMDDVVEEFDALTVSTSSGDATSSIPTSTTTTANDSGGGGLLWWILGALGLGGVALWLRNRFRKKSADEEHAETADKIRAELRTELDELANDVLVLNSPVDLSENAEAIAHYRAAAQTYTSISDEFDDLAKLDRVDLEELHDVGARVAHARWQMDAAEALTKGEPIPEKPEIERPPEPATAPAPDAPIRLPQQAPRPRVPYRTRTRSSGGLLDLLIAGAARSRRSGGFGRSSRRSNRSSGGGLFGGSSRRSTRSSGSRSGGQRPGGGGLFGSSSRSSSRSRRSTTRTRRRGSSSSRSSRRTSISSNRRSSSRRSSSRRSRSRGRSSSRSRRRR